MLPERIKPALQGVVPSHIVTCSQDGTPNIASLSQVWYVDESHVALSRQFFAKTIRNLLENPVAFLKVINPEPFMYWEMELVYVRTETDGDLFHEMAAQLEAIATMTGMENVFRLKGADIYKVLRVHECTEDWE